MWVNTRFSSNIVTRKIQLAQLFNLSSLSIQQAFHFLQPLKEWNCPSTVLHVIVSRYGGVCTPFIPNILVFLILLKKGSWYGVRVNDRHTPIKKQNEDWHLVSIDIWHFLYTCFIYHIWVYRQWPSANGRGNLVSVVLVPRAKSWNSDKIAEHELSWGYPSSVS